MSENLERKSADFVRSLIKFLCIFRPGPGKIFSLPRSITTDHTPLCNLFNCKKPLLLLSVVRKVDKLLPALIKATNRCCESNTSWL